MELQPFQRALVNALANGTRLILHPRAYSQEYKRDLAATRASFVARTGKRVTLVTMDPKETRERVLRLNGGAWPIGLKIRAF